MRVVFTDHISDDSGRLFIRLIPVVVELIHRKEHSPVHGLQAIAHVGQCSPYDNAHSVVHVRLFELVFDVDGKHFPCDFFGCLCH